MIRILLLTLMLIAPGAFADPPETDRWGYNKHERAQQTPDAIERASTADDVRDLDTSKHRRMIVKRCKEQRARGLTNDGCEYYLSLENKPQKPSPGIWRAISSCGPKGEICID